jgi:hypothetical protein
MLIALPVAAVIVVLLRHVREAYEHSQLYGSDAIVVQHAGVNILVSKLKMLILILKSKTRKILMSQTILHLNSQRLLTRFMT